MAFAFDVELQAEVMIGANDFRSARSNLMVALLQPGTHIGTLAWISTAVERAVQRS
jgi:hypothetical protein